ncbi:SET domain-containing protein, partial [Massarina eburnea CBS 473.64]
MKYTIVAALTSAFVIPSEAHSSTLRCALPQPQALLVQDPATCPSTNIRKTNHTEPEPEVKFSDPIWAHAPHCFDGREKQYCTHTTNQFLEGGLSIIATSDAASEASKVFSRARTSQYYIHPDLEVQDIPGKGKGLVAKKELKKGTVVMVDAARIITSSKLPFSVTADQGITLMNSAVHRLPEKDKEMVLDLDKSAGGTGIDDILKTNSFACQFRDGSEGDGEGEGYLCLFPQVSRINHACRPNTNAKFIPATLTMEIKTLRTIPAGEELSISYGRLELLHQERQDLYRDGWHFTCTCSLCSANTYAIAGSDQRRQRFKQLREKLGALTAETFDSQQVIAWEKEVLEISEKEGFETLVGEDLERLAYVYSGLGRRTEAVMWAKRARRNLESWVVVEGGWNLEAERVEGLLGEL